MIGTRVLRVRSFSLESVKERSLESVQATSGVKHSSPRPKGTHDMTVHDPTLTHGMAWHLQRTVFEEEHAHGSERGTSQRCGACKGVACARDGSALRGQQDVH